MPELPSRNLSRPPFPRPAAHRRGFLRGGALFGFAGAVLLASLGVVIWVGRAQQKEIRGFTSTTPQWVAVETLPAPAAAELDARLRQFVGDLEELRPTRILLTPAELNHAIATREELAGLRSIFAFREVVTRSDGPNRLRAQICFPSRTFLPWDAVPYLNGTMLLEPRTTPQGPWLDIVEISPQQGSVPDPVRNFYSQSDLFVGTLRNPRKNPRGSAALAQIGFAEVTPTGLLLATNAEAAGKSAAESAARAPETGEPAANPTAVPAAPAEAAVPTQPASDRPVAAAEKID